MAMSMSACGSSDNVTFTDSWDIEKEPETFTGIEAVTKAIAESAIRAARRTPRYVPIRGGTDGAQLSFRGLPCPNLGAGGYAFHGPSEHIAAEDMDTVVEILLNIVCAKEKEE